MKSSRVCGLLALTAFMWGCATYVNIPAQRGDVAQHNPNDPTVRAVLAEALHAVVDQYPLDGPFAILLPEHTSTKTYRTVAGKLGQDAVWPGNRVRNDLPILEVKQILIRRQDAQVDVIRPTNPLEPGAAQQVVTVELVWHPLQGWLTQRVRAWRLPVETAMRLFGDQPE